MCIDETYVCVWIKRIRASFFFLYMDETYKGFELWALTEDGLMDILKRRVRRIHIGIRIQKPIHLVHVALNHAHTHFHTHTHARMHARAHTHTQTHTIAVTHAHTHTHIYTNTLTHSLTRARTQDETKCFIKNKNKFLFCCIKNKNVLRAQDETFC